MARPRKNPLSPVLSSPIPPHFTAWAESLGEALGRGVARGINQGLASPRPAGAVSDEPRRRGRPPKQQGGPVPAERRCKVEGCGRQARSKGLCSAHYQAERRKQLQQS